MRFASPVPRLCFLAVFLCSALPGSSSRAATPQEEAVALLQKAKDAKDPKARMALFTQVIAMNQAVPEALYWRGLELQQLGQYDAAIKDFDEAVRIFPDYPQALSARGMVRYAQGNYGEAMTYVERAIALEPANPQFHLNRGFVAQGARRWDLAIKDFEFVLAAEPRNAIVHYSLGRALIASKRTVEALTPLSTAITLDPKLADAYLLRSLVHLKTRNDAAMLADLDHAIAADPKFVEAYTQRGFAKNLIDGLHGNKGGEDFTQAVKLAPLDGSTWLRRAEFNSDTTPPRTALVIADCRQAIKLGFKVTEAYQLMGLENLRAGHAGDALGAFNAAKLALLKKSPQADTTFLDGRIAAARGVIDARPPPRRAELLGDWGVYDRKQLVLEYRLAADGTGIHRGTPITWTLANDELTVARIGEPEPEVYVVAVEAGVLILYPGAGESRAIHHLRLAPAGRKAGAQPNSPWPAASDVTALVGHWATEDLPSGDEQPIYRLALAADGTGAFDQNRTFTWRADPKNLTLTYADGRTAVHRYALVAKGDALLLELPEFTLILRSANPP